MLKDSEWRQVPDDPDSSEHLGYELIELDVLETKVEGRPQVLVLPTDEDQLRADAFIVADESAVRNLNTMM